MAETLVKVKFELDSSDWHGHGSELLWAALVRESEGQRFQIINSPFFARGISHLDVVSAIPIENHLVFEFTEVIQRGGHSTYMIIVLDLGAKESAYWNLLEKLGCSYESTNIDLAVGRRLLLSVDVPPSADIYEVYEILEIGESNQAWMFQEGFTYLRPAPAA
jgi:hypothetical protein